MTTSANVTQYEVTSLDGRQTFTNSQHAYCKNTIQDWLKTFTPPENYRLQLCHPDEDEADHYSKCVNLKDYLDGKYRFTLWREEDGNIDDSHYCAEHGHHDLKENCVYCLRQKIVHLECKLANSGFDACGQSIGIQECDKDCEVKKVYKTVKKDKVPLKEFQESIQLGLCPFCKSRMKYYDGALGFESMRCYDCNFEVHETGFGFIEEKKKESEIKKDVDKSPKV